MLNNEIIKNVELAHEIEEIRWDVEKGRYLAKELDELFVVSYAEKGSVDYSDAAVKIGLVLDMFDRIENGLDRLRVIEDKIEKLVAGEQAERVAG